VTNLVTMSQPQVAGARPAGGGTAGRPDPPPAETEEIIFF